MTLGTRLLGISKSTLKRNCLTRYPVHININLNPNILYLDAFSFDILMIFSRSSSPFIIFGLQITCLIIKYIINAYVFYEHFKFHCTCFYPYDYLWEMFYCRSTYITLAPIDNIYPLNKVKAFI